jgi:hypothetical protein
LDTIQQFAGRPSIVERDVPRADGSVITERAYISVHDAQHIRMRGEFKQRLSQAHPDHGGTDSRFRIVKAEQERWLLAERTWYAEYDLEPPLYGGVVRTATPWTAVGPPPGVVTAVHVFRAHAMSIPARLWRILKDGAVHPTTDFTSVQDGGRRIDPNILGRGISRLRERGATIQGTTLDTGSYAYQLVSSPATFEHAFGGSRTNKLAEILADGLVHTRAELCRNLPATPQTLGTSLHRLCLRGAPIRRACLRGVYTYQLLPSSSAA